MARYARDIQPAPTGRLTAPRQVGCMASQASTQSEQRWRPAGPIVRDRFLAAVARFGVPASTLTDNAMVFTTRLL